MTSTTHASADDLGPPNTWSADGVRYSSAAHVHNLIQGTCSELYLDLKILLASQTLDENFKFHTELKDEKQIQILLSFVAVAGTSRFKMTSTTRGPSEASADGVGLPNTWSRNGDRFSSAAHVHNLIKGTCTEVFSDLKILVASENWRKLQISQRTQRWRTETDCAFLCGSRRYLKIQIDLNNACTFRGVWRWAWVSKHLICWWSLLLLSSSNTQPNTNWTSSYF